MQLPELVTEDRDRRIYELRKAGFNYREIGKRLEISPSTAHAGFKRAARKEQERYGSEMQDVGWLFLERYDTLLKHLLPFTKAQTIQNPETGEQMNIPPSYDAVDRVVKVMASMQRMLGLDKEMISFDMSGMNGPQVDSGETTGEIAPDQFAKNVVSELIKVGALGGADADILQALMGNVIEGEVVEDAELVDGEHTHDVTLKVPSLTLGRGEPEAAPEWLDDDEEEYEPGEWLPPKLEDAGEEPGK